MLPNNLIADNLCEQGYHIIDHFFSDEQYHQLQTLARALAQDGLFEQARIGLKIQAQHNTSIRSDQIHWLDNLADNPAIQFYLLRMDNLAQALNQSLFLSLKEFETHFAMYQPGSFYKKHVDQFHTANTRKISCVYYLNENWQESFGGTLKLYSLKDALIKEIAPLGNRFVCFNSELPHEVCPTQQTRYSITGWMKTQSTFSSAGN